MASPHRCDRLRAPTPCRPLAGPCRAASKYFALDLPEFLELPDDSILVPRSYVDSALRASAWIISEIQMTIHSFILALNFLNYPRYLTSPKHTHTHHPRIQAQTTQTTRDYVHNLERKSNFTTNSPRQSAKQLLRNQSAHTN